MQEARRHIEEAAGDEALPPAPLPRTVDGHAFFIDIDGTLLDLAATPSEVVVPEGLIASLRILFHKADGAAALVTGRSLAFVDERFPGLGLPVAGLHGAELRGADGQALEVAQADDAFTHGYAQLEAFARERPGLLLEHKGSAFAAHYRLAPELEEETGCFMKALAFSMGTAWTLQTGKCVFEIRPANHDKGQAVARFLELPAFAERIPVALGDDRTDEAMFDVVNRRGGVTIKVGVGTWETAARLHLAAPRDVRYWIGRLTA